MRKLFFNIKRYFPLGFSYYGLLALIIVLSIMFFCTYQYFMGKPFMGASFTENSTGVLKEVAENISQEPLKVEGVDQEILDPTLGSESLDNNSLYKVFLVALLGVLLAGFLAGIYYIFLADTVIPVVPVEHKKTILRPEMLWAITDFDMFHKDRIDFILQNPAEVSKNINQLYEFFVIGRNRNVWQNYLEMSFLYKAEHVLHYLETLKEYYYIFMSNEDFYKHERVTRIISEIIKAHPSSQVPPLSEFPS